MEIPKQKSRFYRYITLPQQKMHVHGKKKEKNFILADVYLVQSVCDNYIHYVTKKEVHNRATRVHHAKRRVFLNIIESIYHIYVPHTGHVSWNKAQKLGSIFREVFIRITNPIARRLVRLTAAEKSGMFTGTGHTLGYYSGARSLPALFAVKRRLRDIRGISRGHSRSLRARDLHKRFSRDATDWRGIDDYPRRDGKRRKRFQLHFSTWPFAVP